MRFTEEVVFVKKKDSHYDPEIGKTVAGEIVQNRLITKVTTPTKQQKGQLFGDKQTAKIVVHLKQPYKDDYDYLLYRGKSYFFVNESIVGNRQVIYMNGGES